MMYTPPVSQDLDNDNYQPENPAATGPITPEDFRLPSVISSPIPAQPVQLSLLGTTIYFQEEQQINPFPDASYYWDASTMAPLNPTSVAAIARLRAYKPPPFPLWDRLPVSRRAAVLMLLYADKKGDLRVVITMRAASLRSFSGHAALPGGKADSEDETPYQIARREAWEEIGLPMDDSKIPAPFAIEPLCYLPCSLARTELVVRPCIALLHSTAAASNLSSSSSLSSELGSPPSPLPGTEPASEPTVEGTLIPRLDAKEVAAVFSAPFHNFLKRTDESPPSVSSPRSPAPPQGEWYTGNWTEWNNHPWRLHFFYVPVTDQHVSKPAFSSSTAAESMPAGDELEVDQHPGRYKVWGMTARMLVDAARVAYGEEPEFEHNQHFGDEEMIEELEKMGRLTPKKRKRDDKM